MKKKLFLLVAVLMAVGQNAFAYDFSAVSPSGHTLYYKIIDSVNHYVMLTYPADVAENAIDGTNVHTLWGAGERPSGTLVLPDTVSYEGIAYTVKSVGGSAFRNCPINVLVMSNTIDSLGVCAFEGCSYLSNITYSNTLRYIGDNALRGLSLGNVILPSSVRVIGGAAFTSSNITSITLNDSLEVLSGWSLALNPLTSLYIPASVREIGTPCWYTGNLTTIIVDPDNPYYDSRNNCNAILNNMGEVVQACNNTILPEGATRLYGDAFRGCNYNTFFIPNTVTEMAFVECHIGKLILSSTTIKLNTWGLTVDTIQFLTETPPVSINNYDGNFLTTPIIVPCNTLSAYLSAPIWSDFTNMRELGTPQITVNAEHGTAIVETYPSCGNDTVTVSATTDEEHYHFVGWSDGSTQNPYTLVLNGNTTLTALFAIDSVLIRATSANPLKGAVMGGGVVPLNGTTTLTAIPSGNSIFLTWSNGVTDNPYTLTATSDTSLQAYFTLPDTLIFRDTINHYIHDTTFINNYVHDTTIQYVNQYIHDTTYINNYVHDTTILYMNQYVHDTTYINNYIHDTVRMTTQMFDTTIVNVYHFDTAIYNTYHFDTLIVNNHYYDTVYITTHHYDTIYITEQGIGDVDGINAKVYSSNGQVVVEGANGNMVTLYDVTGRVLAAKQDDYAPMRFDAPATGTYMIKIGAYPARKVVVIR